MECPICLDKFKDNQSKFKLSCGHEIHYRCFLLYVMQTDGNIFIKRCIVCIR